MHLIKTYFLFIICIGYNFSLKIINLDLAFESTDGSGKVIINLANSTSVHLCSDNIDLPSATILCRMMNKGYAKSLTQYSITEDIKVMMYTDYTNCFGDESEIDDCYNNIRLINPRSCISRKLIGLKCTNILPNLIPNVESLQRSAYVQLEVIYQLTCAIEENCLHPSTVAKYKNWTNTQLATLTDQKDVIKKLLRFSSIITNRGTTAFLPAQLDTKLWQWHQCHSHYHSMAEFATYQILHKRATSGRNPGKDLLLAGHKASFCLEDNSCLDGVQPYFRCSNNQSFTGTQGITPGCSDLYLHDIDCQWIDITNLPYGRYIFRLIINPHMLVAETNYHDNAIACEFYYFNHYSAMHYCHLVHPYSLW